MTGNASKEAEKLQRKFFRQNVHRIWGMVKSGSRYELSDKDNNLAEILMDHEEHSDHFENTDILDGREYESGMILNPFLHISTHQMVEDQLVSEKPVEAALLCESIEAKGYSRHEAIHVIIMILIHMIFNAYKNDKLFDEERYICLLVKCKKVKPSEMQGVVEREFFSN